MASKSKWLMIITIFVLVIFQSLSVYKQILELITTNEFQFPNKQTDQPSTHPTIHPTIQLTFSSSTTTATPVKCEKSKYSSIGIIHNNCSESDTNNHIGVVSIHMGSYSTEYDVSMIVNNHLSYISRHKYIYFEITNYHLFNMSQINIPNTKKREKQDLVLLSKMSLIYKILSEYKYIKYLLYVDFDVLFWNCSQSIEQSILEKSKIMYNNIDKDIIISNAMQSLVNSGVILYKTTAWTLSLLKIMTMISRKYRQQINTIHKGWGDQNVFIAIFMGYKYDDNNNTNNNIEDFNSYLKKDPRYNTSLIVSKQHIVTIEQNGVRSNANGVVNIMCNHTVSLLLHKHLDFYIQQHVALLSRFDMNFAYKLYKHKCIRSKLVKEPFIMHFAGPIQKEVLKKNGYKKMVGKPTCA